jgi:phosphatidylserine decarboxylase
MKANNVEERMPTYIRLGISILYQKAGQKTGAVDSRRIKALLKSMSEKQGKKFTDPSSRKEIQNFVKYHSIPIDEILMPLSNFNNFNEFFYRKLKVYLINLTM